MRGVFAVEYAARAVFDPDKVNPAGFGKMAPHVHWHIIPRFVGGAHFPNPVRGRRRRCVGVAANRCIPVKWPVLLKSQLAQLL